MTMTATAAAALDETMAKIRARLEGAYEVVAAKLGDGQDDDEISDTITEAAHDICMDAAAWMEDID